MTDFLSIQSRIYLQFLFASLHKERMIQSQIFFSDMMSLDVFCDLPGEHLNQAGQIEECWNIILLSA